MMWVSMTLALAAAAPLSSSAFAFAPIVSPAALHRPTANVRLRSSSSFAAHPLVEFDFASTVTSAVDYSAFSSSSSSVVVDVLGEDGIKLAFDVATFFPQLPWLFLILLPNAGITRRLLGGYEVVALCCLVHFYIVIASIVQPDGTAPMAEFANVFDPSGDPQKAMVGMMQYPNFVSEEWSHVLTWDLFVGRWIWLDGLKRGIFTSHSVLLCNLIGPPGLLLHWLTSALTGNGLLPGNEATEVEDSTQD
ncbi:hypothetical protein ACHAW5_008864 [Stephanodiscus triporus]|uniref:Uncharacterized protein n=1 Tax=Stephanodiscus triporus TaxID=2934178 RepID=A0ABD3QR93_9STRA